VTAAVTAHADHTNAVLRSAARRAASGHDLDSDQAHEVADALLSAGAEEIETAALLAALAVKGATAQEIAAIVRAILAAAAPVPWDGAQTTDIVGTGGKGASFMNISTMAALLAAAAGATVAKAGNRAATSRCGSADLLGALGVPVDPGPAGIAELLRAHRFAFVYTPTLHPRVGRWAYLRRRLGFPTVFNLAGPLANPVARGARLVGATNPRDQDVLAEAAALLKHTNTWVVSDGNGLDELSTAKPTRVLKVTPDGIRSAWIDPVALPIGPATYDDLVGGDPVCNAALAAALLAGQAPAGLRDAVVLNAGAALHMSGFTAKLDDGVALAAAALADGRARRLVHELGKSAFANLQQEVARVPR
jgi:anthranilate phosphoribosyltransferase